MPKHFTHTDFEKHVNQMFRTAIEEISIDLELIECGRIETAQPITGDMREPFSLVFRGPMQPVLNQRVFRLEHAEMGQLDVFLVPIGPDNEGMRYEAVFT